MKKEPSSSLLPNLALTLATLIVSLVGAEFAWRSIRPAPLSGPIFEFDSRLGHKNRRNHRTTELVDDRRTQIRTNALGFRMDREVGVKDPKKLRVLFLGDSFTFGTGLNLEEMLVSRLEEKAKAEMANIPVDFVNAGVGGYGTQEEVSFFEEHAQALEPDAVILLMGPNDVDDNFPLFAYDRTEKGLVLSQRSAVPQSKSRLQALAHKVPGYNLLSEYSALFGVLRYAFSMGWSHGRNKYTADVQNIERKVSSLDAEKIAITKELFLRLKALCDQRNVPLLVASVGTPVTYGPSLSFLRMSPEWFAAQRIPFVDVSDKLKSEKTRLTFFTDKHYSPAGTQIFANHLWPQVQSFLRGVASK